MTFEVRRLTAADAAAYRDVRLEALESEPTAFASSPDLEAGRTLAEWSAQLERAYTFGAFDGERLMGIATWFEETRPKTAHRGNVVAVFVRPEARGRGAGGALFEALIESARGYVKQLHLSVTAGNAAARRLYERFGFEVYGTEPRSLSVDGHYYDEHLMVLRLDEGSGK